MEMLNVPVTREAHSPGSSGALRSLQPSTLQVPEGGEGVMAQTWTRGTTPLHSTLWRTSALGKEGGPAAWVWGRRADSLPLSSAARGPGSMAVGQGCTGGLLEREVEGSK